MLRKEGSSSQYNNECRPLRINMRVGGRPTIASYMANNYFFKWNMPLKEKRPISLYDISH
ncbi:MAG: hypothetical protein WCI92_05855 [Bacteroidota bacterium]